MRPILAVLVCLVLLSCSDDPVGSGNSAPSAADVSATTQSPDPVAIALTGSDPDGDALTFQIVDSPDALFEAKKDRIDEWNKALKK